MDVLTLSKRDLMLASLDLVAEAGVDIVPAYFERFFALYPADAENFHNRASAKGAMVNEMLTMLLAQAAGEDWVPMIMRAQVTTHYTHGDIALEQYRGALTLLVDVLRDTAGSGWTAAHEQAWCEEAEALFALIARYH